MQVFHGRGQELGESEILVSNLIRHGTLEATLTDAVDVNTFYLETRLVNSCPVTVKEVCSLTPSVSSIYA